MYFKTHFFFQNVGLTSGAHFKTIFPAYKQKNENNRYVLLFLVNQQCVVYKFQCDLCDASYVGYTLRHLHQRVNEHKNQSSSIGRHYSDKHFNVPENLDKQFFVLKTCRNKFDCLVHEMLLVRELTPSLNFQSDSIRAKLFACLCISYLC